MGKGRKAASAALAVALLSGSLLGADGGLLFEPNPSSPWTKEVKNDWNPVKVKLNFKNRSEVPWFVQGVRFDVYNGPSRVEPDDFSYQKFAGWSSIDDGNYNKNADGDPADRTELRLKEGDQTNPGTSCIIPGGGGYNIGLHGFKTTGKDWSPQEPYHYLIKTGSFASDKGFIDADPVDVDSLDKIINKPDFYDPDHYVRDSMGQRGGKYSGGFIDTWMDQETLIPVTQLQINFLPDDQFITMNGHKTKFRPDLMGIHQSPDGNGPMYAMALAMAQEYMHVDMQMLMAIGSHESMAGLEVHTSTDGGNTFTQEVFYGKQGGSMEGNTGKNGGEQLGTMHYITTSFKAYCYDSYPKFFPYATQGGATPEWFAYPHAKDAGGLGYCAGNSATIVTTTLLNTLYCWFGFEILYNATSFDYRKMNDGAADYEWAAKMFMSAWNGGWGKLVTDATTLFGVPEDDAKIAAFKADPDISDKVAQKEYVTKVYQTLPKLTNANLNSVLNPAGNQNCEVYDTTISLEKLAEFFYGINNDFDGNELGTSIELAEAGKVGIQGVLQHFRLSDDKRKELWADLKLAFDKMKNRAPSSAGTDMVSLRYDFITLLRIAKGYINIDVPLPLHPEFKEKVDELSKVDNIDDINVRDSKYPFYQVDYTKFGFEANGDFFVEIKAWDNDKFDTKLPIEWTIDEYWENWNKGELISEGDTVVDGKDFALARFKVVIPHAEYKKHFGDKKPGYGWARVTDRNRNSTVQEFVIPAIKYPRFEKAYMRDLNGDGIGDSLVVKLVPAEDDENFYELDAYETLDYAWPAKTPLKGKDEADQIKKVGDSLLAVIDKSLNGGAGEGAVHFQYPLDKAEYKIDTIMSKFSGDVADSVGPAIQFAKLIIEEPRDKDTVYLTISEPLSKIDKENHLYCLLKDGSTVNEIKAEKFEHVKDNEYKVIFAKSALADEDSIKLTFDKEPVEDAVGNRPVDYNQWVPLAKDGGKVPEYESVVMLDTDGDGDGDSVVVKLTLGGHSDKYTVESISGGKYSWPGTSLSETLAKADMIDKSESKFSIKYDSNDGRGEGKIALTFPEDITLEAIIDDKVGPALQSAKLSIVDAGRDYDTLVVTLSEELTAYDKEKHEYFLFDDESGAVASEKVVKVSEKEYKAFFPKASILDKKKVKLAHNGDVVKDTYDNKPMDINQWVPLEVTGGKEPSIKEAQIFDINGDGRGDSVRVILQLGSAVDKYDVEDVDGGKYSWPGTSLSEPFAKSDMIDKSDDAFSFRYDSDASAGSGKIELSFPEDTKVTGTIDDKVGPVIDKASCLQQDGGRDKDTLVLETSEIIADNFNDDTKYVIIFENEADTEGDTLNVETIAEESGAYRLVVAKNAITYGDWIQFNFDSGIEDKSGNKPLAINQKVLITVKGGVAPVITNAAVYDTKGDKDRLDGNGDSIFVKLELAEDPKALTVDSLKSVTYTWGSDTKSKDLDDLVRISDSEFALIDESLKGGSGSGTITLAFKTDGYDVSGSLADKVAPVVTAVEYYNWSSVKDTFTVTFSEELDKSGSNMPLIKSGDKTLTVRMQKHDGAKVTYSLESGDEVTHGDSLWIKGDEEIEDVAGNEQVTDDNVRILVKYFRVASLERVEYRESDSRPDGYIDEVVLNFDADLDESILTAVKENVTLPSEREFSINGATLEDDKVILSVSQNKDLVAANTATESYDKVALAYAKGDDTLACVAEGEVSIDDKLAPVLLSARFTPAETAKDGKLIDELTVTYSEKVRKVDEDEPFRLSDLSDGDAEYSLVIDGGKSGSKVIYDVTYETGKPLPGKGDSIWIFEAGDVEDEHGNVQEQNTVPVELVVGKYKRDYTVAITPTPYDVALFEDSVEAVIRVLPKTRALPDNIKVQCVIYDKVGNVIRKVTPSDFGDVEGGRLSFSFMPKNKNGRRLGEGSYAVRFLIETDDAEPDNRTSYLFIKGEQPGQKKEDKKEDE